MTVRSPFASRKRLFAEANINIQNGTSPPGSSLATNPNRILMSVANSSQHETSSSPFNRKLIFPPDLSGLNNPNQNGKEEMNIDVSTLNLIFTLLKSKII